MTSPKPAILVISGAWHVPESYSKLTHALESSGYDVHIPRLPSMNEDRPPTADLATDTAVIRSYAENLIENGRTVAVILHSYGGQVGTNALIGLGDRVKEGKAGGVSHLIYMTAFAQPENWSMIDKVKQFGQEDLIPYAFDFADDKTVVSRDPKALLVGNSTSLTEAEVDAYIKTLVHWNGECMYQGIMQTAWKQIPVSYIHTTQDMTVPLDYQKSMVETMKKAGRAVRTFTLETGHCPNLSATSEVVDVVNKIISGSD